MSMKIPNDFLEKWEDLEDEKTASNYVTFFDTNS